MISNGSRRSKGSCLDLGLQSMCAQLIGCAAVHTQLTVPTLCTTAQRMRKRIQLQLDNSASSLISWTSARGSVHWRWCRKPLRCGGREGG